MKIDLTQSTIRPLRPGPASHEQKVEQANEIRDAYRTFVGETFFGQLLKSMRSTQDKPAYFHGGQAEEMFRSQLDQTLAQNMTEASADKIADPMFEQQFPAEAALLKSEAKKSSADLAGLSQLRRY